MSCQVVRNKVVNSLPQVLIGRLERGEKKNTNVKNLQCYTISVFIALGI